MPLLIEILAVAALLGVIVASIAAVVFFVRKSKPRHVTPMPLDAPIVKVELNDILEEPTRLRPECEFVPESTTEFDDPNSVVEPEPHRFRQHWDYETVIAKVHKFMMDGLYDQFGQGNPLHNGVSVEGLRQYMTDAAYPGDDLHAIAAPSDMTLKAFYMLLRHRVVIHKSNWLRKIPKSKGKYGFAFHFITRFIHECERTAALNFPDGGAGPILIQADADAPLPSGPPVPVPPVNRSENPDPDPKEYRDDPVIRMISAGCGLTGAERHGCVNPFHHSPAAGCYHSTEPPIPSQNFLLEDCLQIRKYLFGSRGTWNSGLTVKQISIHLQVSEDRVRLALVELGTAKGNFVWEDIDTGKWYPRDYFPR